MLGDAYMSIQEPDRAIEVAVWLQLCYWYSVITVKFQNYIISFADSSVLDKLIKSYILLCLCG